MRPVPHLLFAWRIFYRLFELCIVNSMVVYFHRNPQFKQRTQAHRLYREILAHELMQPFLDKRANGGYDNMRGPGCRPNDHSTRLKGKHFAVSQHPTRKSFVICAYQKKPKGKYKQTKTSNYCPKCKVFVC